MSKASFRGVLLAESEDVEIVEGKYRFPPETIKSEYFMDAALQTICHWKGTASYKNIVAAEKILENAAWYYAEPKAAAQNISSYFAFDKSKGILIDP